MRHIVLLLLSSAVLAPAQIWNRTAMLGSDSPPIRQPFAIASADFNGDGLADLAVTNTQAGSVMVFFGDGQGSFAPGGSYPVGETTLDIVAADFNGDSLVDLAVANLRSGTISVLLGRGGGAFAEPKIVPADPMPSWLAAADINNDGRADLAVARRNGVISVFLAIDADALFAEPVHIAAAVRDITAERIAFADLNGDGLLDLLAGHHGRSSLSLYVGNGDGSFRDEQIIEAGLEPACFAIADFNEDGRPDIVVSDQERARLRLFTADEAGAFVPGPEFQTGGAHFMILAGDWNLDGKPDIAVSQWAANSVTILLAGGDNILLPPVRYLTGQSPSGFVSVDANADGAPDLGIANTAADSVGLLYNDGQGAFLRGPSFGPRRVVAFASGDLNLDGKPELGTVDNAQSKLELIVSDGAGSANLSERAALPPASTRAVVSFLDHDGNPDLITISQNMREAYVLYGRDDGGYAPPLVLPLSSSPSSVVASDLDGDGRTDLLFTLPGIAAIEIAYATPDPQIFEHANLSGINALMTLVVTDWNFDQIADILAGGFNGLWVVTGRGGRAFSGPVQISNFSGNITYLALADLNRDGRPDIIGIDATRPALFVIPTVPAGFSAPMLSRLADLPRGAAIADFDLDGYLDVAVLDSAGTLLYGAGMGTFRQPPVLVPAQGIPNDIAAFDADGDGRPDLVYALGGAVGIRFNDSGQSGGSVLSAPRLVAPPNGTVIRQNVTPPSCRADPVNGGGWLIRFAWSPPPPGENITGYELTIGRRGSVPVANNVFVPPQPEFTMSACARFVGDSELDNWEWRVRSRSGANIGPYSETGTFRFEPCRLEGGRPCGVAFPPVGGGSGFRIMNPLAVPRSNHTATVMRDGRVLIAGGHSLTGTVVVETAVAEIFDPVSGAFLSLRPTMIQGRSYHTATLLNDGRVLIAGGIRILPPPAMPEQLASVEIFDPANLQFRAAAPMLTSRSQHTASLLPDGRVLIAGGLSGPNHLATAQTEIFNPRDNSFSPGPSMSIARAFHAAATTGGQVLLAGGFPDPVAPAEIYDPIRNAFRTTGRPLISRSGHQLTTLPSNDVLVTGGSESPIAELYRPATGAFTQVPVAGVARRGHQATLLLDGTVYLTGGIVDNMGTHTPSGEIYRMSTGLFEPAPPLYTPRAYHAAVALRDGRLLVIGGMPAPGAYTNMVELR